MAKEEHLALLKQGVKVWNAWRDENPGVRPDLVGAEADLGEANLNNAQLDEAFLGGVNLRYAGLQRAKLKYAYAHNAHFDGARLSDADITAAELSNATLCGADLSYATLFEARLSGASFDYVDLEEAYLRETVISNVDLSKTKGLASCHHFGPSTVDHRTLQRSGHLPLNFLRGVGLPDNLIDYLPSLLNQPIQFHTCFISYSSNDDDFARRLYADLQTEGIRCWFAPEDMKIGDRIRTRIDEVIRLHEKLLLVLSEASITSDWVEKEVETALEKERETRLPVLFPIRLDDAVMESRSGWVADIKRSRHIGDFRSWKDHDAYQKGLQRLLRDLTIDQAPVTRPT
jgi:hypothetical protein